VAWKLYFLYVIHNNFAFKMVNRPIPLAVRPKA